MQFPRAREQHAFALHVSRVGDTAIDGTYRRARFMVEKADAFGALGRHDEIDVLCDRRTRCAVELPWHSARVNRRVRTLRLARSAIDALARDRRRHLVNPGLSTKLDCDRLQKKL